MQDIFTDIQQRQQAKHFPHGSSIVPNNDVDIADVTDVMISSDQPSENQSIRSALASGLSKDTSLDLNMSLEVDVADLTSLDHCRHQLPLKPKFLSPC